MGSQSWTRLSDFHFHFFERTNLKNILFLKKLATKDHILKNSINVKCPEQASRLVVWGWWWELGFGGTGESLLMSREFWFVFAVSPCGIWIPCPGIEPIPPAVEAWSHNLWTYPGIPGTVSFRGDENVLKLCQWIHNFVNIPKPIELNNLNCWLVWHVSQ